MKILKFNLFFLYLLLIFIICNVYGSPFETQYNTNSNGLHQNIFKNEMEPNHQFSLLKSYMDQTANPCEDFYQYACGNWEKYFEVPIDVNVMNTVSALEIQLRQSILEILIENKKKYQSYNTNNEDFDIEKEINTFFSSCLDINTINKRGSEPIADFLTEGGGFPLLDGNKWSPENYHLEKVLAFQSLYETQSFFHSAVFQDFKDSRKNILYLAHPSLGLNSHADYLESYNKAHLDGYRNFISEVFELLNAPKEQIQTVVDEIIDLETKLANITDTRTKIYSIPEMYDAVTINILNEKYPEFNWNQYIRNILNFNLNYDDKIVIFGVPKTDEIFNLLINTERRIIANYISWRTVLKMISYLDDRFIASRNKFIKILTGSDLSEMKRDLICSETVKYNIGMALSALYVKKFFNEKSKNGALKIGQSILKAFRNNLNSYDWMDNDIKALAEEKVDNIILSLGYPDFILNKTQLNTYYEGLHFENGNYFENYLSLKRFENIKKEIFKEVDKSEWSVIPATVNAFFAQNKNTIYFPAAILQPPVYHADFSKNLNYGAIGFIFGHELTHGFDTSGRLFDADGNTKNWWNDNSDKQFNDRAQCFIDQYSKYKFNNKTINGDLTKGENIADNGGIRLAYKVYTEWLNGASNEEKKNEVIPGLNLSPEQVFFVAFAQWWCEYIRPEAIENIIETDKHAPSKIRISGTLQNFEEFSNAFQCSSNSTMNPIKKCRLW